MLTVKSYNVRMSEHPIMYQISYLSVKITIEKCWTNHIMGYRLFPKQGGS